MSKTQGLGERLRERLRVLGYWQSAKNKPDVIRFSVERGYVHSYIYRWLDGQTPRGATLLKLARDLEVSVEWLLGLPGRAPDPPPSRRRKPVPIRGGSANAQPLPAESDVRNCALSAALRWLRCGWSLAPAYV